MRKKFVLAGLMLSILCAPVHAEELHAVKVEAAAKVPTAYADGVFTYKEESIPSKITIYQDGESVDTGKSGNTFDLEDGEYKAVAHNSTYFKTSDAKTFTADEDKTVKLTGSVPQKKTVTVKDAKEGFTYEIKAAADIKDKNGQVICPKGAVIGEAKGPDAAFTDLPIEKTYNGVYEVSEKKVPDGYFPAGPITVKGNADSEVTFKERMTTTVFKLVGEAGEEITDDGFSLVVIGEDGEEKEVEGRTVKALKLGETMTVKSKEIPAGFLPFEREFVTSEDDKDQVIEIPVSVTRAKISVIDTDGSFIAGCTLAIMQGEKVIQTFTSGKSEKEIKKLPEGEYTLTMTNAAKGYCIPEKVPFTISRTDLEVKIKAIRPKGYVLITLLSVVNRTPINGAVFDFKDNFGNTISTVITDKNGQAKTDKVEIGLYEDGAYTGRATYKLQEVKTADGYVLDQTEYKLLFDYVDDTTPEVHIEATLPNRSVVDEPVKTKLVLRQVPANAKGKAIKTEDKRLILVIAALILIAALLALTFIPEAMRKKKLEKMQKKETPIKEERDS